MASAVLVALHSLQNDSIYVEYQRALLRVFNDIWPIMPDRITQLNALFQEEISRYFQMEVPEIFVSITKVSISPDLHEARVWVSFLNKRSSQLEELRHHLPGLRRSLGERLRLKRIPRIELLLDTSLEYAEHISEIIQKIEQSDQQES